MPSVSVPLSILRSLLSDLVQSTSSRVSFSPFQSPLVTRSTPPSVLLAGILRSVGVGWYAKGSTLYRCLNLISVGRLSPGRSVVWQLIGLVLAVSVSVLETTVSYPITLAAVPHIDERVNCPIPRTEFEELLEEAAELLNVNENEFDISIRHREIKNVLKGAFPDREIKNIPLAVKRREDNPELVTWTGSNTVLGKVISNDRLTIRDETRVTALVGGTDGSVGAALLRDLKTNDDVVVFAKVILCVASRNKWIQALTSSRPL